MRYMFKEAAAFYQDITGWTTTSLTTSTGMFTGATAWLDRVQRGDGTGTSGPISEWVHKPCLADERALSGWCVPCGGGGIRPAGDDPSSGDTMCAFPDKAALKAAINSCLDATNGDPTGVACCSRPNVDCGAAGTLEMPEWDVSLVTDMQALFAFKADFNGNLSRWDVGSVRNMRDMFYLAPKFVGGDLSSWNTSKVTTMRAMFNGGIGGMFNGDVSTWDVSSVTDMMSMFQRRHLVQPGHQLMEYLAGDGHEVHVQRSRRLLPGHHRLERRVADHRDVHRRHRVARSNPAPRRNRNLHRRPDQRLGP